jgi:hypothetical protein
MPTPSELLRARVLPDDADLEAVHDEVSGLLVNHPQPAYLVDFSWRVLACNRSTEMFFGLRPSLVTAQRPHVLRLLFDAGWGVRPRISNWSQVARHELVAFFLDQATLGSQRDRWYGELIDSLTVDEDFARLWDAVQRKGRRALLLDRGRSPAPLVVRLHGSQDKEEAFTIGYVGLSGDMRLRVARYERLSSEDPRRDQGG